MTIVFGPKLRQSADPLHYPPPALSQTNDEQHSKNRQMPLFAYRWVYTCIWIMDVHKVNETDYLRIAIAVP